MEKILLLRPLVLGDDYPTEAAAAATEAAVAATEAAAAKAADAAAAMKESPAMEDATKQ